MAHNQKRRGQNTTPASHQKTRDPTPTPRKRGRARPRGTPHGRGVRNNCRTNARTSSEPRDHRREGPQKAGEKTCTVHMKAGRPKRQEKTRKDAKKTRKEMKKREKAHTIHRMGQEAEKDCTVQDCPPNSSAAQETAKQKRGARSRKVIKWQGMSATS